MDAHQFFFFVVEQAIALHSGRQFPQMMAESLDLSDLYMFQNIKRSESRLDVELNRRVPSLELQKEETRTRLSPPLLVRFWIILFPF